jgi:predicted HicB family RNase H-like nuclease
MKNIIEINGHKAVISFDPDIGMLRGEFLSLNGGADFYANNIADLKTEGTQSLNVFLEICTEKQIHPFREFSGRFNLRLDPQTHEAAVIAAAANNKSLNEWVSSTIIEAAHLG